MAVLDNIKGEKVKIIYSIFFAISTASYSIIVSINNELIVNIIQAIICVFVMLFLNYKFSFFETMINKINKVENFVAVSFIVVFIKEFENSSLLDRGYWGCVIMAIPFLFAISICILRFVRDIIIEFFVDYKERVYFAIIICLALFIAFIIGGQTELFYGYKTDIVYGSDCSLYFERRWDTWVNGTIIRPSTSIANFPATFICKCISYICYFVPNIYPISCMAVQLVEVFVIGWMLAKILNLNFVHSILFQWTFIMGSSVLIFSLAVERYISTLFLLILAVNQIVKNKANKRFMIAYSGMPLFVNWGMGVFSYDEKREGDFGRKIQEFIVGGVKTVGWVLLILLVNGRIMLLNPQMMLQHFIWYSSYSGSSKKLPFEEQMRQFFQTIEYMFIHPELYIDANNAIKLPTTETWSVVGILILLICLIVFIIYKNEKLVQVSMWTVVLCVVIHMIIGLGAVLYEMFLYSSLYTWAFLVLVFRGIRGLCEKFIKDKQDLVITILLSIILVFFVVKNIPWIIEIINFGTRVYPVIAKGM